jgi:hypothetical protein
MITTSETTKAITAALLQFQGHVSGVKRDAKNPHFRSNYATLENVIDTARPVLQEFGVMFMQAPGAIVDGALEVTTRLSHAESGEWIQSTMHMPLGKRDPQGAGSATTYGLRYSLMAMLGLPPTDDDGEAAMERPTGTPNTVTGRSEPPRKANGKPEKGWREDGTRTAYALKTEQPGMWAEFDRELMECQTVGELTKLALDWSLKAETDKWPFEWRNLAKEEINKWKEVLLNSAPDDDVFPGDLPANGNFQHPLMAGE